MSKETPEITIGSAQQFKQRREAREQGDVITLSSGLVVRLKRPEITKLIARGLVPATLVQRFMAIDQSGGDTSKLKAEDIESILQFQRIVAIEAMISPKIVTNPDYDNNEIDIEDLESTDLEEIWAYGNGGLEGVAMFLKERNNGLNAGLDSTEIPEQKTE